MKIHPRCAPCLLSRVQFEAELSTKDLALQKKAVLAGIEVLRKYLVDGAPATHLSTKIHREAYRVLGDIDPYREKKRQSNEAAKKLLPLARDFVSREDSFRRAVLAAIVGNSFDFGVLGFDADKAIAKDAMLGQFEHGLDVDDTERMKSLLGNVVYLADNCGEIVFDTLLFEEIRKLGGRITLVVRGAPILNDVTMKEVMELGLDKKVDRVLTTGSNAIGLCLKEAPSELVEALGNASLIISKGMANYETMSEYNFKPIAYLLKTKCESVAEAMGLERNMNVARVEE
ncbi:MAG: ARMT1-like domain-containing protein [Candidatus Methanoperedens sp.]|nr:ARMT1-like domain-containing protein [Candidatus Methanoperedens sp.]MCZ7395981.1 ARMT1-like domain-containing protein [Candidatus Methanoperedens sp.]